MNLAFFLTPKSQVSFIYDDNSYRQGLEKLRRSGYRDIPVLGRDGSYRGTVSEGDFLWSLVDVGGATLHECESMKVSGILRADRTPAVRITADVFELYDYLLDHNFAPVVDDRGCFMGIVTRRTILTYQHPTEIDDLK